MTAPFYTRSVWTRILGVALAASLPLSWHLAFVAIPSAGARFLPPLLKISRLELLALHKSVARGTVFFGLVHGIGEFVWVVSQGELGAFGIWSDGVDLLYVFGLTAFVLLSLLALGAALRRHRLFQPSFRQVRVASVCETAG